MVERLRHWTVADRTIRKLGVVVGVVAPVMIVVFAARGMSMESFQRWHGDVEYYHRVSSGLLAGLIPYVDFPFEYPPFALVPMSLPQCCSMPLSVATYASRFVIEMAIVAGLVAALLWDVASPDRFRRLRVITLNLVLVVAAAPILPWRFDLVPAAMSLAAVVLTLQRRSGSAGLVLGIAIATKVYPVVLLPLIAMHVRARDGWSGVRSLFGGAVLAVGISILPFVFVDALAPLSLFQFHLNRGLEIESLPAGLIQLGQLLGWTDARPIHTFSSWQLDSTASHAFLATQPAIFILAYAALIGLAYRRYANARPNDADLPPTLIALTVAALLVFILGNRVFSPQYVVWALPFAPLLPWRQAATYAALCALTTALYPGLFPDLLAGDLLPIVILNLRNLLAATLTIWLVLSAIRSGPRVHRSRPSRSWKDGKVADRLRRRVAPGTQAAPLLRRTAGRGAE